MAKQSAQYAKTETALNLIKRGERAQGCALLREVVAQDAKLELAWWSLAQHTDDMWEQVQALEKVLVLNPAHAEAQSRQLRLHQRIAREAAQPNAAKVWKELLPTVPLELPDAIDDPYQCPYCGSLPDEHAKRCPSCGKGLYMRVAKTRTTGLLNFVLILLSVLAIFGLAQGVPALLAVAQQNATTRNNLDGLLQIPGFAFIFGNFLQFTPQLINVLLATAAVRAVGYFLVMLGLREKWRLAFYSALILAALDSLWQIALMAIGYTSVVIGLLNLGLAIMALVLLFGLSYELTVNEQRILVQPDGNLQGAASFFERGHVYRERGMWALAVAQWRKALGLAPGQLDYYKHLGIAYTQIKRYDRSVRVLEEAHRQAPDNAEIAEILRLVQQKAQKSASPPA